MRIVASVLGQRYAWLVAALTFASLMVAAGLRAAPSVLMVPLQANFGWSRGVVSAAAAVGIFRYGLAGPFAAALMQTLGIRRVLLGATFALVLANLVVTVVAIAALLRPAHGRLAYSEGWSWRR